MIHDSEKGTRSINSHALSLACSLSFLSQPLFLFQNHHGKHRAGRFQEEVAVGHTSGEVTAAVGHASGEEDAATRHASGEEAATIGHAAREEAAAAEHTAKRPQAGAPPTSARRRHLSPHRKGFASASGEREEEASFASAGKVLLGRCHRARG
jgi:hypothetical protein